MTTRILYVITKANWGGAQRYVYDLATEAKKNGYEVLVAYGDAADGKLANMLAHEGIRTLPAEGLKRDIGLLADARALTSLIQLFRTERPDIVHLNSSKAGVLGALAAQIARVPQVIFTAHGWAFNESRPWWQKIILRVASAGIVALSDTVICVSNAVHSDIAWVPFSSRKIHVIHNGLRCVEAVPRSEARTALAPSVPDAYWIGMVSELHPTKRIQDAIHAFSRIAPTYPKTLLFIIGAGEERENLDALIKKLGLSARIFLLGFIADPQKFLHAFDLFVHASQSEALGYVLLEAGCAGVPTIATRVGGIPEIIHNDTEGLLVSPHNPIALAEAIAFYIQNPIRAETAGSELHRRVRTAFSIERMISKTFALYH
ncbi:MAG TPA: glycosyltransferase family 4 protein [Candidatus Paceibacterota bacterium]|nr:glycosyltransferase family 4 protein [Candidatus Paceibacterota bacterium]